MPKKKTLISIDDISKKDRLRFDEIKIGSIFCRNGHYYVKISRLDSNGKNAMNLNSFVCVYFKDHALIYFIESADINFA